MGLIPAGFLDTILRSQRHMLVFDPTIQEKRMQSAKERMERHRQWRCGVAAVKAQRHLSGARKRKLVRLPFIASILSSSDAPEHRELAAKIAVLGLGGPKPGPRELAMLVLQELDYRPTADDLRPLLGSMDQDLRLVAIRLIGNYGWEGQ